MSKTENTGKINKCRSFNPHYRALGSLQRTKCFKNEKYTVWKYRNGKSKRKINTKPKYFI